MFLKDKNLATFILPLMLLLGLGFWGVFQWHNRSVRPSSPETPKSHRLSRDALHLESPPDWSRLLVYHDTMSAEEFLVAMDQIYAPKADWRRWIRVEPGLVSIKTSPEMPELEVRLTQNPKHKPQRPWRSISEMPTPKIPDQVLSGLKIAIDPGHLGGEFAAIEGREFAIGGGVAAKEGEMALLVAQKLKPRLEALGAEVSLTRETHAPKTPARPHDFEDIAAERLPADSSPEKKRRLADQLFYRTSEIRARAKWLNEHIKPDLVLCLHFNAEPWGPPEARQLVTANHFHLLSNGCYGDDELAAEDQRFEMLLRLFQRIHQAEAALAPSVIEAFDSITQLPAYSYPLSSRSASHTALPAVWHRNLLANRLFLAPVLFYEPYVMNSYDVYTRVQLGDYQGWKMHHGQPRLSLYEEYTEAVIQGLVKAVEQLRPSGVPTQ